MSVASGDGGGGAACDCRRARGALLWWCCVLAATAGALGLLRTQQLEARVALLEQTVALHAVYPPAAPAQPAHALPLRREPRDANECICPPEIRPKPLRPSVIAGRSDTGRRQRPAAVAGDHRALGALTPSKKSKIRAREVGALVRRSATRRLAERGGPEPALTASVTISGGGSDQERVRRARAAGGPARSRETKQIVTAHRRAHYV